jgi:hypothetical protein
MRSIQEPEEHEQRPCDGRFGSKFHSRKMRSSLHGHSLFLGPRQLRTRRQDTFAQPAVAVGRVIASAWIELLQKAGHPHRTQGSDLRINAGAPQCSGCRRAAIDGFCHVHGDLYAARIHQRCERAGRFAERVGVLGVRSIV